LLTNAAPARARLFYGNYAYYLDRIARERGEVSPPLQPPRASGSAASSAPPSAGGTVPAAPPATPPHKSAPAHSAPPLTAAEQRERDKQRQTAIRRLERQEREILAALEALETEKSQLEAELSLPAVYTNGEKAKAVKQKLDRCSAAIEAKTAEWEAAAMAISNYQ
jgi:ATP-binding cassette subfamily F protein 3